MIFLVKLGNTNSSGPLPAFARCRQLGFSARREFSAEAAVGRAGRDNQAHCSDLTLGRLERESSDHADA